MPSPRPNKFTVTVCVEFNLSVTVDRHWELRKFKKILAGLNGTANGKHGVYTEEDRRDASDLEDDLLEGANEEFKAFGGEPSDADQIVFKHLSMVQPKRRKR